MRWAINTQSTVIPAISDRVSRDHSASDVGFRIICANRTITYHGVRAMDHERQPFDVQLDSNFATGYEWHSAKQYSVNQTINDWLQFSDFNPSELIDNAMSKLGANSVYWYRTIGFTKGYDLRLYYGIRKNTKYIERND